MIITGSWIFSVLVNIPAFLVLKFDKESYSCTFDWPEEWMDTAFQMNWNVLTILTFLVMAVIYSRVVYTLWVKNNHDNHLTHQQRVRVYFEAIQFLRLCSRLVPENQCPGTDTKWFCVQTLCTRYIIAQFSARVQGLDLVLGNGLRAEFWRGYLGTYFWLVYLCSHL